MLQQKLITLAAILGILACGACFREHYTPPPPPPITTEGLRRVGIVVSDSSEAPHLNAVTLSSAIAEAFIRFGDKALSVHVGNRPEDDAEIYVEIQSVIAVKQPDTFADGLSRWRVEMRARVSLTRQEKRVLWQGTDFTDSRAVDSYAENPEDLWRDPLVQSELLRALSQRTTALVIYQPPIETSTH